jgi:hypothetical protein
MKKIFTIGIVFFSSWNQFVCYSQTGLNKILIAFEDGTHTGDNYIQNIQKFFIDSNKAVNFIKVDYVEKNEWKAFGGNNIALYSYFKEKAPFLFRFQIAQASFNDAEARQLNIIAYDLNNDQQIPVVIANIDIHLDDVEKIMSLIAQHIREILSGAGFKRRILYIYQIQDNILSDCIPYKTCFSQLYFVKDLYKNFYLIKVNSEHQEEIYPYLNKKSSDKTPIDFIYKARDGTLKTLFTLKHCNQNLDLDINKCCNEIFK